MNKSALKTPLQSIDLSSYAENILSAEDHQLFGDAVEDEES
ncbi:hypothetical protein SAMN02745165_01664 [Malonomonas rubra DSM 5091]|uniref:Uncharacterized protein n=1 Tax=Malonomonas rubra DSM 5091 TaxID=1122189 RepID=A0A1M6H2R4_MALRU|nr:hypothetical protein [Malonomonas rubra]SHJ16470.1 hypothetical protein SAMN02745165_01664 [Malonomonas rubra DSM 5091]